MAVPYGPRIWEARSETVISLLLALAALAGLLVLAALVVLWDVRQFQKRVGELLQVSLEGEALSGGKTTYARDTAARLSEEILHGPDKDLFHELIDGPQDHPTASHRHAGELRPRMEVPPAIEGEPKQPDARRLARTAASSADRVVDPHLPVVVVRRLKPRGEHEVSDLHPLYASGRLGAGTLGRPGETTLKPDPFAMPAAPAADTLRPAPPSAAPFTLTEPVATFSQRLVAERPPEGYPSLDEDIEATFTVYREPKSAEAYFRLDLRLRPASRIPTIPKDVLFLVDISQSIGLSELKRVREAVISYLRGLDAHDRWNLVVFSERQYYLHEESMFVPAGDVNAEGIRRFVRRRIDERRTDVFQATQLILSRIPPSNRPCNVFLISDGKATEGTSDVRRIVHGFQRVNRENFSIFTFNGGPGGNLYLLSLLSYRSRGRLVDCGEVDAMADSLAGLCRSVDAPVLTNVVASYTNIKTSEVCPVVLPNLYRHHPITFWGRTTPGKEVTLRVAGLGEDGPRELFFRTVVPPGDDAQPEVVRGWARGQAHEKIARLGDDPKNRELKDEILALAKRYKLEDIRVMLEGRSLKDILPWNRK